MMKKFAFFILVLNVILLKNLCLSILHNEIINEKNSEPQTDNQLPETPSQDKSPPQTTTTTTTPESSTVTNTPDSSTQSDAKTQASFVKGVIVNKAEMESFEEWKLMKLKDESINGKNLKQQQQQQSTSQLKQNDQKIEILQRRKNYASLDCGAKIIGNNKESSNPSHILTESKDDYMLNSCSSKVWFILELCEPVKINEIQIANYELFSNVPRQFKVFASERFIPSANLNNWPSKYFLGTFEANNTRNLQSFGLKDSLESKQCVEVKEKKEIFYTKFVKFEMLSHYGNEHYCPLSVVRVYGTSLSDDEDTADDVHLDVNEHVGKKEETTEEKPREKPKFFDVTSVFLTNIISVVLGERFKFPNFFSKFKSSNLNDLNVTKPSKSTRLASENETYSSINPNLVERRLVLNTDMHRILCFTSSASLKDCCQCSDGSFEMNKNFENSSFNFYSSTKYCSYYYLMITSIQVRSNSSLLSKYLVNIKEDTVQNSQNNFTQFSLNNINYYILNEWLDNQTMSTSGVKNNRELKLEPVTEVENMSVSKSELVSESKETQEIKSVILENKKKENEKEVEVEKKQENEIENIQKIETSTTPKLESPEILETEETEPTLTTPITTSIPTVTQAPIPNGKDALFARLTNRIKMLELNMSLSSQYLEKLSQHYRKQMDEMQKAFNLTTSALIDTIRVADERDIKQNEKIILIEKKIEKIEKNMIEMDSFLNEVKLQTYLIIWTAIFVLIGVFIIELSRCFTKKVDVKDDTQAKDNNQVNLDEIIESKCKALMENQEELFRRRLEMIEEMYKTNQVRYENLEATSLKDAAQTVAAATVVSSTFAVVAAVSLAAANAQFNSVSQTDDTLNVQ